jgi:tetratricopeptide (TPR) repeat protein
MNTLTPQPDPLRRAVSNRWRVSLCLVAVAGSMCLSWQVWSRIGPAPERELVRAKQAVWNGDLREGLHRIEQALKTSPDFSAGRLFAAQTALRLRLPLVALEHCQLIRDGCTETAAARRMAGEIELQRGRVTSAERNLLGALNADPQERPARIALMSILRLEGRNRELAVHVRELLKTGDCPSEFLFATAWPDRIWLDAEDQALVKRYQQESPDEPLAGIGLATQSALTPTAVDDAIRLLKEVVSSPAVPDEAFAKWGTLLVDAGRWDEFTAWNKSLPTSAETNPHVWHLRGLHALQRRDLAQAKSCFARSLRHAPHHPGSVHQLAGLLAGSGHVEATQRLLVLSRQLQELRQLVVVGKGQGGTPDAETLDQVAALLEELGRDWEAFGWSLLAIEQGKTSETSRTRIERIKPKLTATHPLVTSLGDVTQSPVWHRLIATLPDPTSTGSSIESLPLPDRAYEPIHSRCRFADVAEELGVRFRFHQRPDGQPPTGTMFEISAGGVGVIDYDRDGWPDLYLSQGCDWPPSDHVQDPSDRLLRNQAGIAFHDVAPLSAIHETDYGQGVTVGDVNDDGFHDLFVTNIGHCRLWINQGDGTFSRQPAWEVVSPPDADLNSKPVWSMSAAIADFNADDVADIFIVNYLGGDALTKVCDREGHVVQCRPTQFPGEPNRLLLGDGAGRFMDQTDAAGAVFPDGKGMGVVVADFDDSRRLSLFVSNDTTQNSFFRNVTPQRESSQSHLPPLFEEQGALIGVGFGDNGQPQASMGIALDDANRDGRLDLVVTNFTNQASNLFMQQPGGSFTDLNRLWRLYDQSYHRMGWGTQFLDADLDGDPDLIVANGHLEDYSRFEISSRMTAQFFHNVHGERFEEASAADLGPYFQEQTLGRTVVRGDWNRDGRDDVAITHVDRPLALLRNETLDVGHHLSLRLIATASTRDAIGTRVTVVTPTRSITKQLTAGDGFQCSNQRQLVFGLGTNSADVTLRVVWPSGREQHFTDVACDSEAVLIEGRLSVFLQTAE